MDNQDNNASLDMQRGRAVGGELASMAFIETPRLKSMTDKGLTAVIALSVMVGVTLTLLWIHVIGDFVTTALQDALQEMPSQNIATARDRIGPGTLTGPSVTVTFPPSEPTVVNVWLQGCQDCMPAFEAQKRVHDQRAIDGIPVVNVAYGQADPSWAQQYGVAENLVFDRGAQFVSPLGIGTFTTLVIDSDGDIRLWDRPDREGFADRIKGAVAAIKADARCSMPISSNAPQPVSSTSSN